MREVKIALIVDANGTVRGVRTAEGEFARLDKKLDKTGKKMLDLGSIFNFALGDLLANAVRTAITNLDDVVAKVFEMGSSAAETESKFNTVFQGMAGTVDAFGETFANVAGLTQTEFRDLASVAGAILQGMGADINETAQQTQRIVKLAADFSSFHNVAIGDAFAAIRSGITGESEPLKRFGIVLDEAAVKTRALTETGKANEKQLTQLEKVQARLNLIFERAGVAVGDLERTQDSAANTARRLAARIREQGDEFAQKVLPAMERALRAFDRMMEQNQEGLESWSDKLAKVASNLIDTAVNLIETSSRIEANIASVKTGNRVWGSLIETWEKTNILFDINAQLDLLNKGLDRFNARAREAQRQQRLLNMLLPAHGPGFEDADGDDDGEGDGLSQKEKDRIAKLAREREFLRREIELELRRDTLQRRLEEIDLEFDKETAAIKEKFGEQTDELIELLKRRRDKLKQEAEQAALADFFKIAFQGLREPSDEILGGEDDLAKTLNDMEVVVDGSLKSISEKIGQLRAEFERASSEEARAGIQAQIDAYEEMERKILAVAEAHQLAREMGETAATAVVTAMVNAAQVIGTAIATQADLLTALGDAAKGVLADVANALARNLIAQAVALAVAGMWGKAAKLTAAAALLTAIGSGIRAGIGGGGGGAAGAGATGGTPTGSATVATARRRTQVPGATLIGLQGRTDLSGVSQSINALGETMEARVNRLEIFIEEFDLLRLGVRLRESDNIRGTVGNATAATLPGG